MLQCNPATHNKLHRYGSEPGKKEPEIVDTEYRNRYKTVIESNHRDKGAIMTVSLVMIFGTVLFVSIGAALIFS